ncbi:MAG: DsbA family protein, partial [Actinomycetes bacterium]
LDEFDIRWHAFELDPHAPPEPSDLRAVIESKYGPGSFDGMTERLCELGAVDGIAYRFDLAQRVNTFDAHRLTAWAATFGPDTQDRMLRRLFRAYFTEGAVLSDHDILTKLAADADLDPEQAGAALESGAYSDEVRADTAMAQDLGVGGVPAFVLNRQFLVSGAQDTETFVRLLSKAAATMTGDEDERPVN